MRLKKRIIDTEDTIRYSRACRDACALVTALETELYRVHAKRA